MADIRVDVELKSGEKYSINKSGIESLSSLSQSNSDASTIYYGMLSNTGDMKISDSNEEVKSLIEKGLIDISRVKVDIFVNGKQIRAHTIQDAIYNDKVLDSSLSDDISYISSSNYYNPEESNYLSYYLSGNELIDKICEMSNPKIQIVRPMELYGDIPYNNEYGISVYMYLSLFSFDAIDLEFKNLNTYDLLDKFCKATQLNLVSNSIGEYVFIPARPVFSEHINPILIKSNVIYKDEGYNLFLKNKIDGVDIKTNKVIKQGDKIEFSTNDLMDYESFNNKSFFKSDAIYMGQDKIDLSNMMPESEGSNYYIFTTDVELDHYVEIPFLEQLKLGVYYGTENANNPYYFLPKTGDIEFQIQNFDSIEEAVNEFNRENLHLYYPIVCGFLKSHIHDRFVNKYTIVYGVSKFFVETGWGSELRFFLLPQKGSLLNIYKRSFEETQLFFGYNNSEDSLNQVETIEDNLFLSNECTFHVPDQPVKVPIYEYIGNNIINDYKNGIKTKKIQICCGDMYYTDGVDVKAKDWSKGEIIDVGDIINIENEKYPNGELINWRVTGCLFKYDGAPMLELELQECIMTSSLYEAQI